MARPSPCILASSAFAILASMHFLPATFITSLLFLRPSLTSPTPQADTQLGSRCADSWKTLPYETAIQLVHAAPPEPASGDDTELACRNTTALALSRIPHPSCPPWQPPWHATNLPYLVSCNSATKAITKFLGGYDPGRYVTFGDKAAGTCQGQMYCLEPEGIVQDDGNCRVHLEFDPVIPGPERREGDITWELDDSETFLEWLCGFWEYVVLFTLIKGLEKSVVQSAC